MQQYTAVDAHEDGRHVSPSREDMAFWATVCPLCRVSFDPATGLPRLAG